MRRNGNLQLIDLDSAMQIGTEFSCGKYSSMFLPPECIYYNEETDEAMPKTFSVDEDSGEPITKDLPYELVPAAATYDSWALGVTLYHLCSGQPFLLADVEDNVDADQLKLIYEFTDEFKKQKVSKISDKHARNLVSQLLNKDPKLRPTMDRAIVHPFITGKSVMRMPGEFAHFDIFLSYRVASDLDNVEYFYNRFTSLGYRVWW